jgi:hypothetical protein
VVQKKKAGSASNTYQPLNKHCQRSAYMETMLTNPNQLSILFEENLPKKPYCADELNFGVQVRSKKEALKRSHIQYNDQSFIKWLCFDLDINLSLFAFENKNLPEPSFIVINPKNGHSHYYYGIKNKICKTDAARIKPLKYLAAIENAFIEKFEADENFVGLIGKTPHHKQWRTFESQNLHLYDLGDLAEWVDLKTTKKRSQTLGLGRNCQLFDALRRWGYKTIRHYKNTSTHADFFEDCLTQAQNLNNFITPLHFSEVKAIAKSVAKWLWTKFDIEASDKRFSKLQAARAKLGKGISRPKIDKQALKEAL